MSNLTGLAKAAGLLVPGTGRIAQFAFAKSIGYS
jgi:hypothetical protein